MSIDFAALTNAVVAGMTDVRSCLIVSRDGLVLGASPATEEGRSLDVWTRIAALGEVERGFVTVRDEVWVFCRRGTYAAVATAGSTARPGVILDTLEQMVLMAEEARLRKDGLRSPAERDISAMDPPRGLRTALHKERSATGSPSEESITSEAQEAAVSGRARRVGNQPAELWRGGPVPASAEPDAEAPAEPDVAVLHDEPAPAVEVGMAERRQERSADPVDPAELSREFAGILAESEEDEA